MQGFSWCNIGSSAMHLKGTGSCNNDSSIGLEPAGSAFDVAELLHAHVGAEATLSENVSSTAGFVAFFCACELERNAVSEDGRVAMGDVGEWSSMYEDRCTLYTR